MGRVLFLGLMWIACAQWSFAQPADPQPADEDPPTVAEEDLPPGFSSLPMLEAPPREESGPLGKKVTPRKEEELAPPPEQAVPEGTFVPGAETVAAAPAEQTRLKGYIDGLMTGLVTAGEFP